MPAPTTLHRAVVTGAIALAAGACGGTGPRYDFQAGALDPSRTLTDGGIERRYGLFTSSAPGPRPLVVLLHGGGATLEAFLALRAGGASPLAAPWLELADAEGFHVAVPEGLDGHWNDCRTDCTTGCREDVDDVAFLSALIASVSAELEVDPGRVFVTGESNGGMMSQRMARERTGLLASIGVVNAAVPANNECGPPSGPIPVAYVVGTADASIPWDGGNAGPGAMTSAADTIAVWTALNACAGEPTTESLPDLDPDDGSTVRRVTWDCAAGAVLRYEVDGGGHVPPSIDQRTSAAWNALAGAQNHDLESAHALWAFFSDHAR